MLLFARFKFLNLSRFILALVLALFVWAYVSLTVYPEQSLPLDNITVDVKPPLALDLVVRSNFSPAQVKITVSGPRDKVTGITASSLLPYIDLSKITKPTTDQVKVELKVPEGVRYKIEPEKIEVQVEEKKQVSFKVLPQLTGEVATDFILGDIKISPANVDVSGPASLVAQVKKVITRVDVTNRNLSLLRQPTKLVMVDAAGDEIKDDELKLSVDAVTVDAPVSSNFQTRDVPIRVTTKGTPALGYIIGSATQQPQIVSLYGESSIISQIPSVETEPVDVTGASADIMQEVALIQPKDALITQGSKTAMVTITIKPLEFTTTLEYPVKEENPPAGVRFQFTPDKVKVTFSGPYKVFQEKDFKLDEVKVTVDLQNYRPGTYNNVAVKVTTPTGLQLTTVPTVTVLIVAVPTATPIPPSPTATSTPPPTTTPSPTVTVENTPGIVPNTTTIPATPTTPPVPTTKPAVPAPNTPITTKEISSREKIFTYLRR